MSSKTTRSLVVIALSSLSAVAFAGGMGYPQPQTQSPQHQTKQAKERMPSFEAADTNHDGWVDRQEATKVGLDFNAADTNKDGKISKAEYDAAIKAKKPPA
jgi:hypothetical protein